VGKATDQGPGPVGFPIAEPLRHDVLARDFVVTDLGGHVAHKALTNVEPPQGWVVAQLIGEVGRAPGDRAAGGGRRAAEYAKCAAGAALGRVGVASAVGM
jgi:hypothetical protein